MKNNKALERAALKPCPHCGGRAELEDKKVAYESWTFIQCVECGACVSEGVGGGDGWHDRAVKKWNRRAEPPNDPLTLEELRGMDGEPVWVERLDGDIPWGTYSIVWAATRLATNGYVRFHFEKYGETWLAYHRKPDGGGE